jgi:hypothetical protein
MGHGLSINQLNQRPEWPKSKQKKAGTNLMIATARSARTLALSSQRRQARKIAPAIPAQEDDK